MSDSLSVNGELLAVTADPEMPLLWVLRDVLNLKGSKFGCGRGLCGACTVHLDGIPVRSCLTPLSAVGSRTVTTIEGVGGTPFGKRLQDAWLELDVMQCGYCQAGQLMSASALLSAQPEPTDQHIDAALSGNLCRCYTYCRIRAAIKRAAGLLTPDSRDV